MKTCITGPAGFRQQRGFTLIELMIVIAIISALAAILVPAVQQVRTKENARHAAGQLSLIHPCAVQFLLRTGHFPASLADLAFCDVDRRVLAGESQGYRYLVLDATRRSWKVAAEPHSPGKTGMDTLIVDQTGAIQSFPTPGAEQAQQEMFDKIDAAGAHAVAELLALDPDALAKISSFTLDSFFDIVLTADVDGDGSLTLQEVDLTRERILATAEHPIRDVAGGFFDAVNREMSLGAGRENGAVILGVPLRELQPEKPLLVSYQGVCRATRLLLVSPPDHLERSLCATLAAAQEAEQRGDPLAKERLLDAYRQRVEAHAGKKLTYRAARTQRTLSKTL